MSLAVERESPLPSAGSRPGRPAARKRQAGATTAGFCIRLRGLFGRMVDADQFVNDLVDDVGRANIPHFRGRFSLHGHSAGGQFAARYLVAHPGRLEAVVLSAPGAYPFPDPSLPWPNGMAAVVRDELSGSLEDGKAPDQVAGSVYTPRPSCWLAAASEAPVSVLVGSRDTEAQYPEPGQPGSTRIERATAWVPQATEQSTVR